MFAITICGDSTAMRMKNLIKKILLLFDVLD